MTSGRSADSSSRERGLDGSRVRERTRRVRNAVHLRRRFLFDLPPDDVVRNVEINRTGAAVERRAHRLLDVVWNASDLLDALRVFAVRLREFHLPLLLERTHAVLVGR